MWVQIPARATSPRAHLLIGRALPSSGRRSGSSLDLVPFRNSSIWFPGRYTAPHSRSPSRLWAMHPPTRRISRRQLPHQLTEIPPIEPISADSLAYPPETLAPLPRGEHLERLYLTGS